MSNITNLRERTADMAQRGATAVDYQRLVRDWQAAYDERESDMTAACMTGYELARAVYSDQIKLLREALEQYARVPNWGRPFDANGNLTNKRCLFMRFDEMHGFELAQETLAATGPSDILNEGENDVLRRKDD